jgi:diaminopimelate decarboxylase
MTAFHYQDGELHAEAVALGEIARRFGTPCYVYSRAALEQHLQDYQQALHGQDHLICYAVKANSNLAVLNVLARQGAGFDIVSGGELQRVMAAGGDPAKVVFSGVAKTEQEMSQALQLGIHCFNVESLPELQRLQQVASRLGKPAPVSIRVNPDVDAKTHPYISTGLKENKFGIDIDSAPDVYRRAWAMSHIEVIGVDCHIGSQLTETLPFLDALQRVLTLVDNLQFEGIQLRHLDIGGGLGVQYHHEQPPTPQEYLGALRRKLGDRPLTLVVEPGRSISANAGVMLTRVEFLKSTQEHNFAIVDAAMNDMLRPALYQSWMALDPVIPREDCQAATYDVVGPICETGDFIAKQRQLAIQAGDLLALRSAGAYGFVMSSNYNSRGRAAEVMVDGERCHLVRQREDFSDLIRGESLLP